MQDFVDALDTAALMMRVVDFAPRMVAAVGVLLAFWIGVKVIQRPLRIVLRRSEFTEPLIRLLVDNVLRFSMLGLGIVMAVSQLGIDIGAALAGIGVMGIAVGFAAQESVANTIAGFLIFWDKPFQVGHYITTQGEYGKVKNITMRTTRIQTPQNMFVVIPNRKIIEEVLVNHSLHGRMRIDLSVGIAYKETVDEARETLLEAVAGIDKVLSEPPPRIVVTELADSSVNLGVHVWIEDASDEKETTFNVLETSKKALDAAGIEIPFPHLQLFLDDVKQNAADKLRGATARKDS